MTVKNKMFLLVGSAIIGFVILGGLGQFQIQQVYEKANYTNENTVPSLLALNAAVEAARAGQHGKGFNVVATEVRNLAIRSSNSAKETSLMVEETIRKITSSAELAENNSKSLKTIVEGITKLTELVTGVAFSSNEQRLGIQQVNSGINEIAKVTMTNSAAAEEMATASDELTGQAKSFTEMVGIFKIKEVSGTTSQTKMYEKQKKRIAL